MFTHKEVAVASHDMLLLPEHNKASNTQTMFTCIYIVRHLEAP